MVLWMDPQLESGLMWGHIGGRVASLYVVRGWKGAASPLHLRRQHRKHFSFSANSALLADTQGFDTTYFLLFQGRFDRHVSLLGWAAQGLSCHVFTLLISVMQSLHAKITGHEMTEGNTKVLFILEIKDDESEKVKVSKLRYSEFKEVHDEIGQVISKLKLAIVLPEFPKRKVFGSTSKSEESILERAKDLANYVNQLLTIEKLRELPIMSKYYIPTNLEKSDSKIQHMNIQICIDRYTLVGDKVHYYVRLRDLNSHEEWTYRARYSELRSLHESLIESKIKNLPVFPKKKFFGVTNESPEDIEDRREQLQKYFNEIFDVKEVVRSEPVRFFVEESKRLAQKEKQVEELRRKNKQL